MSREPKTVKALSLDVESDLLPEGCKNVVMPAAEHRLRFSLGSVKTYQIELVSRVLGPLLYVHGPQDPSLDAARWEEIVEVRKPQMRRKSTGQSISKPLERAASVNRAEAYIMTDVKVVKKWGESDWVNLPDSPSHRGRKELTCRLS